MTKLLPSRLREGLGMGMLSRHLGEIDMTTTRKWLLKSRPHGALQDRDFDLVAVPLPDVGDGQFLVKLTHFSFDPTQRGWLGGDTYLPAVPIGGVVRAGGIGEVVESRHPRFAVHVRLAGTCAERWHDRDRAGNEIARRDHAGTGAGRVRRHRADRLVRPDRDRQAECR
jgi:hypothetical protein